MTTRQAKTIAGERGVEMYYDKVMSVWVVYHDEANSTGTPAVYLSSGQLRGLDEEQFGRYVNEVVG